MRSSLERLRDARDHAMHAHAARGLDGAALEAAPEALRAFLFDLVIVGETLGRIPGDVRSLEPDVPWRAICDMRNLLVHSYWQIDIAIVSEVVNRDLGPLVSSLERLMMKLEREEGSAS